MIDSNHHEITIKLFFINLIIYYVCYQRVTQVKKM